MSEENKNNSVGKVWLVGAGPGDAGLMTLKGGDVLQSADVVVYDALVGSGVLSMIPDSAELIYAGKRSGHHTLKQNEINMVLLDKALEGKRVVRLKGGDPFLFGRGGEELELLKENSIPYEIIPGVTSAFAAPAYAGIPVTHRDFCQSVSVVTGHRRKNGELDIDFEAHAKTGGTLVFMMGISTIGLITKGLLDAGMDPEMPAAIVERGTGAAQRVLHTTLAGLEKTAAEKKAAAPSVIVVGRVADLGAGFSWREALPLFGARTVVTRPKAFSSGLAAMLREKGAEVIELPAISIEPIPDNTELHDAIVRLGDGYYSWAVFTSPSGVRVFFKELIRYSDARALSGCRIAAIGKGSEKELMKHGIRADMLPSSYDGKTLGCELAQMLKDGDRILIPRAAIGGKELTEELSRVHDVVIDDIATYDTVYKRSAWFDADAAFDQACTYAVFTSASTVRGFVNAYPDMDHSKVEAVCIGNMTAAEAEKYGMKIYVSKNATLESLAWRLEEVHRERRDR